jgi:hypothetical protein
MQAFIYDVSDNIVVNLMLNMYPRPTPVLRKTCSEAKD